MVSGVLSLQKKTLRSWARPSMHVLLGSLFMALCSQISVSLWFSPVPLTLQTVGVFILAAALGGRLAFTALLAYLFEGACGLPVFALGTGGIATLFGATAGYLWSFPIVALLLGCILERKTGHYFFSVLISLFLSSVLILASGTAWLSLFMGLEAAFFVGAQPFLFIELFKIAGSSILIFGFCFFKRRYKS